MVLAAPDFLFFQHNKFIDKFFYLGYIKYLIVLKIRINYFEYNKFLRIRRGREIPVRRGRSV